MHQTNAPALLAGFEAGLIGRQRCSLQKEVELLLTCGASGGRHLFNGRPEFRQIGFGEAADIAVFERSVGG